MSLARDDQKHDDSYLELQTSKLEQTLLLETCATIEVGSILFAKNKSSSRFPAKKSQVSVPGIVPLVPLPAKQKTVTVSSVANISRDMPGHLK